MIKIHKNTIELCNVYPSSSEGYYINKASMKTNKDFRDWLDHLKRKNWFSQSLENDLINYYINQFDDK